MVQAQWRSRAAMLAAGVLLAANIVIPLIGGDVYPFTSAPMFREGGDRCCNYRVYSPEGRELPAENWLVQRIYDGNPVGYGVGVVPPEVIEQKFGAVPEVVAVWPHIQRQFPRDGNRQYAYVEVEQDVLGPVDEQRVGVMKTNRWRIDRPAKLKEGARE
jgi:hypothetical protein